MIKIRRKVDKFEVTHPGVADPPLVVSFKRLNFLEAMDFAWELGPNPKLTPMLAAGLLKRCILSVSGLFDESDSPIFWDGDASIFFDPAVPDVTGDDGKPQPFWQWLLNKVTELSVKGEDPNAKN